MSENEVTETIKSNRTLKPSLHQAIPNQSAAPRSQVSVSRSIYCACQPHSSVSAIPPTYGNFSHSKILPATSLLSFVCRCVSFSRARVLAGLEVVRHLRVKLVRRLLLRPRRVTRPASTAASLACRRRRFRLRLRLPIRMSINPCKQSTRTYTTRSLSGFAVGTSGARAASRTTSICYR